MRLLNGSTSMYRVRFPLANERAVWPGSGRNVVWQLESGGPFMLSWNLQQDSRNFRVYDNDVIHVELYQAPTQGFLVNLVYVRMGDTCLTYAAAGNLQRDRHRRDRS